MSDIDDMLLREYDEWDGEPGAPDEMTVWDSEKYTLALVRNAQCSQCGDTYDIVRFFRKDSTPSFCLCLQCTGELVEKGLGKEDK